MPKKQPSKGKNYSREFKIKACQKVLNSGVPAREIAEKLKIPRETLDRWVRELEKKKDCAFPGRGKALGIEAENRRLEKENRELKVELDILKKAEAYFTKFQK